MTTPRLRASQLLISIMVITVCLEGAIALSGVFPVDSEYPLHVQIIIYIVAFFGVLFISIPVVLGFATPPSSPSTPLHTQGTRPSPGRRYDPRHCPWHELPASHPASLFYDDSHRYVTQQSLTHTTW